MPDRSRLYAEIEADLRRRRIEEADRILRDGLPPKPTPADVPLMRVRLEGDGRIRYEGASQDGLPSLEPMSIEPWQMWVALVFILQLTAAALAWLTP